MRGRRSGETRRVGRAKAFDKEGEFCGWQSAARVKGSGWRLGILWEDAAYSESKGWTLTTTDDHEREKTAVATGSRTNLRDCGRTQYLPPSTT